MLIDSDADSISIARRYSYASNNGHPASGHHHHYHKRAGHHHEEVSRFSFALSFVLSSIATVFLVQSTCLLALAMATNYWILEEGSINEIHTYEQYYGFYTFCQRILAPVKTHFHKFACGDRLEHLFLLTIGSDQLQHQQNDQQQPLSLEAKLASARFDIRNWEIACLGLLVASAGLNLLVLLFFACFCKCWKFYLDFITPWGSVATVCSAVALGLYSHQLGVRVVRTDPLLGRSAPDAATFGWSFWVALVGAALQFFATLLYGLAALLKRKCDT